MPPCTNEMNLRLLVLFSILMGVSGCSSNESMENQVNPQPPPITQAPVLSEQVQQANLTTAQVDQLNEVLLQQEAQLQQLQEAQAQNRLALQRLEEKLVTNFELLEHSVSDALTTMKTQIHTLSIKSSASQSLASEARPLPRSSNAPKTASIPRVAPKNPQKAIEDYPLFSAQKKPVPEVRERLTSALQEPEQTIPVPIPLPPQNQIIDERPSSQPKAQPARTPLLDLSPNNDEERFADPNLNEPQNPYQLQSRPEIKKLYDQGMNAMINREYPAAIESFQSMLKQFPDDEYSDNALFWLGHIHFTLDRLEDAEAAFQKVLSEYEHRPTSQGYKTPDAIYMLGKISEARDDKERSAYYFQEVIKRFPGSTAATNAGESLQDLQ